jgi:hypothetical protein
MEGAAMALAEERLDATGNTAHVVQFAKMLLYTPSSGL